MTVLMIVAAIVVTLVLFVAVANEAPGLATLSFLLSLVAGPFSFFSREFEDYIREFRSQHFQTCQSDWTLDSLYPFVSLQEAP